MAVPKVIKIRREDDYRTDLIGKFDGKKQFMAFIVATFPKGPPSKDWKKHKKWYAVLHTFDGKGKHLKTESWFAGTTADGEDEIATKASRKLDELIASLGKVELGDVKVGLFQVEIDGHVFGLVDSSDPEENRESITLEPNDLMFHAPWDGTYDT